MVLDVEDTYGEGELDRKNFTTTYASHYELLTNF